MGGYIGNLAEDGDRFGLSGIITGMKGLLYFPGML
jgi:hypothetical protein